jgi:hypothetical protein
MLYLRNSRRRRNRRSMVEPPSSDRPISDRIRGIHLIQEPLARPVRKALLRHKQAGNPVAVWHDERVVWIDPADIPVDDPE